MPILSIVIPLFNKKQSIGNTINSLLSQSFVNFEIIVVNDGSSDGSEDEVIKYDDSRIKLINQHNKGISAARNTGVLNASGKWVLFLDADDIILPNGLKCLIDAIEDNLGVVAANFWVRRGETSRKYLPNSNTRFYSKGAALKDVVLGRLFLRAGSFIVSSNFAKSHLFDEKLSRYEDMKYIINLLANNTVKYIGECVMCYETGFASASKVNEDKKDKDFGFHLDFQNKGFWEKCLLGDILNKTLAAYPRYQYELKTKHCRHLSYSKSAYVFSFISRINRKLAKFSGL